MARPFVRSPTATYERRSGGVLTPVAQSVPGTPTYAAPVTGHAEAERLRSFGPSDSSRAVPRSARRTDGRIVLVDGRATRRAGRSDDRYAPRRRAWRDFAHHRVVGRSHHTEVPSRRGKGAAAAISPRGTSRRSLPRRGRDRRRRVPPHRAMDRSGGPARSSPRSVGFPHHPPRTVTNGRAGLHRAASSEIVELDHCAVSHPLLDDLVADGVFGAANECQHIRVGAATGERMAAVSPNSTACASPTTSWWWAPTSSRRGSAWIDEIVAGRRWRISAESFFQTRPDGAAPALVDVVVVLAADAFDDPPMASERPTMLLDAVQRRRTVRGQSPGRACRLACGGRREQPIVGGRCPHEPR